MTQKDSKEFSIHIDKKLYKLTSPVSGATLYSTGAVRTGYDLYQEGHGQANDVLVPNDGTLINLENGMHFSSIQRAITPGEK